MGAARSSRTSRGDFIEPGTGQRPASGDSGDRAKRSVLASLVSRFTGRRYGHGAPPGTGATLSVSLSVSPKTCDVASEQKLAGAQTLPACSADDETARSPQTGDHRHQGHRTPLARRRRAVRDLHARHRAAPSHDGVRRALLPSQRPGPARCLIVDGFTSHAEALRTACEGVGPRRPGERWLAVCRAHRAWALDHQAEYLLLYGHDGACAVKQRNPQVDQAFSSAVNVLFSIMRRAVAADEIDTERIEAATPASLRRQLATWRDENDGGGDLPDGALAACMITYAQLHGAITRETQRRVPAWLALQCRPSRPHPLNAATLTTLPAWSPRRPPPSAEGPAAGHRARRSCERHLADTRDGCPRSGVRRVYSGVASYALRGRSSCQMMPAPRKSRLRSPGESGPLWNPAILMRSGICSAQCPLGCARGSRRRRLPQPRPGHHLVGQRASRRCTSGGHRGDRRPRDTSGGAGRLRHAGRS